MIFHYTVALALTILKANSLKNFVHFKDRYFSFPEQLFVSKMHSGDIPSLNKNGGAFCIGLAKRKNEKGFRSGKNT